MSMDKDVWIQFANPGPTREPAIIPLRFIGAHSDENRCFGCPYTVNTLFDKNPDGSGPSQLTLQSKTLSVCCRVEQIVGTDTELRQILIYER